MIAGAVDALFDRAQLPPNIESALSKSMGVQAVLDLMATVGFYSVLGFILNTYDTPLDEAVLAEIALADN